MPTIETIETPFRGRLFSVDILQVSTDAGTDVRREVVRHPGAVAVVPILDAGDGSPPRVVMIRNFRAAVADALWEIPAGKLEPGEAPEHAAARELEEETGYRAGTLRELGRFYTSPGFADELMHVYAATDLRPVGQRLEAGELIEVEPRAVDEVERMIAAGEIADAKTLAALLLHERSAADAARTTAP